MRSLLLGLLSMALGVSVGVVAALYERGWPSGGDPLASAPSAATSNTSSGHNSRPTQGPTLRLRPRIELAETVFNFGEMTTLSKSEHKFVIKNVGKADLTLDQVGKPSCSCTDVEIADRVVPPGGETYIKLEWITKNFGGAFITQASFESNDRNFRYFNLVIEGHVTASIRLEPSLVSLGNLRRDESKSMSFNVLAFHTDQLQITDYRFLDPELAEYFEAQIAPLEPEVLAKLEARSGAQVDVTLKPGLPEGKFQQTIRLASEQAPDGSFEVPITGEIVGDIRITGTGWDQYQRVLRIGKIGPEGDTRTLRLLVSGPHSQETEFRIKRVVPDIMRVKLGERRGKSVAITSLEIDTVRGEKAVNYLGSLDGGFGEIVLETTHPEAPELIIPVSVAADAARN